MDNESNQSQNNTGLLVKIMNNVLGLILISMSHTSSLGGVAILVTILSGLRLQILF